MNQESWLPRNGPVFTGAVALIALLTYLHVTLGELRTEFREELRNITNSLDRVETKIDEVSGYLKYSADSKENDTPLANLNK